MTELSSQPNSENQITAYHSTQNDDEWDKKLDFAFEALKDEYQCCIGRLRNVEEKANKHFFVISIFVTGYFAIISGSLLDKVKIEFGTSFITYQSLLSCFFILSLIGSLVFIGITIYFLLKCLKLVEISRLPNIFETLDRSSNAKTIEFKGEIVKSYQECINLISDATSKKQDNITKTSPYIGGAILSLTLSIIFLLALKIQG